MEAFKSISVSKESKKVSSFLMPSNAAISSKFKPPVVPELSLM